MRMFALVCSSSSISSPSCKGTMVEEVVGFFMKELMHVHYNFEFLGAVLRSFASF